MINLKDKVEYCLIKHQSARNSDRKLINAVYVEYYNSKLFKFEDVYAIKLIDMYELPNPAHVIRWRQKFNEQGKFLPTDERVIEVRAKERKKWHNEMSPSNPSKG